MLSKVELAKSKASCLLDLFWFTAPLAKITLISV